MTTTAIIVAAGRGLRAGGDRPKQWQTLAGQRVIDHTIAAFANHPAVDQVILVLHPDDMDQADAFRAAGHLVAKGGATRGASVAAGLALAKGSHVLIHDAARCCVSARVIDGVLEALSKSDAAAPGLPISDALWRGATEVQEAVPREGLFAAQTPQGFALAPLRAAYAKDDGNAADDVTVARAAGMAVTITPGSAENLKITTAEDFARAARILESRMDMRCGHGFDVHAFGPGDTVMLCGVEIAHNQGLVGHSDADVGLHTLADAIYGAMARGDIGQHFPPSDPQWKGAESHIFLRHAAELARTEGYRITNLDCTLICEAPKIGPHAAAMRAEVAKIAGLEIDRVSVKATTTERLGFAGRKEGIACMATATLVRG